MRALFPGRDAEEGQKWGNSLAQRRSFVKWGSATAGAAALIGFTGCAPPGDAGTDTGLLLPQEKGRWKTEAYS